MSPRAVRNQRKSKDIMGTGLFGDRPEGVKFIDIVSAALGGRCGSLGWRSGCLKMSWDVAGAAADHYAGDGQDECINGRVLQSFHPFNFHYKGN